MVEQWLADIGESVGASLRWKASMRESETRVSTINEHGYKTLSNQMVNDTISTISH
jgi:hypothetical protein